MEPIEVPVTTEKERPASENTLSAPRCAMPFAPPDPSASPNTTGLFPRVKNALNLASNPMFCASRHF